MNIHLTLNNQLRSGHYFIRSGRHNAYDTDLRKEQNEENI